MLNSYEKGHSCTLCAKYVAAMVAQLYIKTAAAAASVRLRVNITACF